MSQELTVIQEQRRTELERTIQQNLYGFRQVCAALAAFRREGLYAPYDNLWEYIQAKWVDIGHDLAAITGLGKSQVYRLADSGDVIDNITHSPNGGMEEETMLPADVPLPTKERQVRPLVGLSREKQMAAWELAVQRAKEKDLRGQAKLFNPRQVPTGKDVEQAVAEVTGIPTSVPTPRPVSFRPTYIPPVTERPEEVPALDDKVFLLSFVSAQIEQGLLLVRGYDGRSDKDFCIPVRLELLPPLPPTRK